ncbi:MAG: ParA family protein [Rhodospirillales bacterium]|nr:ParA family protein [Rhodospirillales bacterium]MBO6786694.1 ParA family protein [Rhodospirillales bacterium]
MPARIIAVAQQKGGAGKTTLAAQLAVAWAATRSVALMDIDPQSSLTAWHGLRAANGKDVPQIHLSDVSGWRVGTELDRLRGGHDIVLIDCPPHAETETKNAMRAADLVVIPVQPSPMDVWATTPTASFAKDQGTDVRLVLNRVPPRSRLVETVQGFLKKDGLHVATATLGNRVAFAASMMEGLGVTESEPSSQAADEIRTLAAELEKATK